MTPLQTDKRVLVVAAHPDDEVLGAGGAIAWHAQQGHPVTVLILGEGISSRFDKREEALESQHQAAFIELKDSIAKAHHILGVQECVHLDLPDNRFDRVDLLDIIKLIEKVKADVKPTWVYTHHSGDVNIDHRLTFEACLAAFRPQPGESIKRLVSFEALSSTDYAPATAERYFAPNVFLNIEKQLELKLQAMGAYAGELRAFPHPRSLQALEAQARLYGARVGVAAAEGYMLIRERIDA